MREVSVRLIALHDDSLRHPEFGKTVSVRLTVFHIRPGNEAPLWNGYRKPDPHFQKSIFKLLEEIRE
jgi:hypothetical protein